MPYDGYMGDEIDTTENLDKMLTDGSSGLDHPQPSSSRRSRERAGST
jgi:hypothetical protein